jgi:hypothetical protein
MCRSVHCAVLTRLIVPYYLRHKPGGDVVPFIYFRVPDGASLGPEHTCPQSRKKDTEALSSETAG